MKLVFISVCALAAVFPIPEKTYAMDASLRGFAGLEIREFMNPGIHAGQRESYDISGLFAPDLSAETEDGDRFAFIPFLRVDNNDPERSHFDVRELSLIFPRDEWELRLGARKVFWGSVEAVHLVDAVNQTDLVENIAGTEKLGQPMANLSVRKDWGAVDFFVLPWFRERAFPGKRGRLRPSALIDAGQTAYEHSAGARHVDYAIRYFHTIGKWDVGLSYFTGTNREPSFRLGLKDGDIVLAPFYSQMRQAGIDATYAAGNWLWKFEGIRRDTSAGLFLAWAGGFEYTFAGVGGTGMDLGVVSEWLYDDRGPKFAVYDNDVAVGARLAFNDVNTSSVLFLAYQSVETSREFLVLRASSRLDNHWRLTAEYLGLLKQPETDLFYDLRDDDLLQIRLAYHF